MRDIKPLVVKLSYFLLYSIFLLSIFTFGQNIDNIFLFKNRYSNSAIDNLNKQNNYKFYRLFSAGFIKSKTYPGHLDMKQVEKSIKTFYPNPLDSSYLVLDFEGKIFHDLRRYDKNHVKFILAQYEFILMSKTIKAIRPRLKLGLYGIPFRFYYESQRKYNADYKFDFLLEHYDFIAPSLYLLYSENEKNYFNRNINFLASNLQIALDISSRIDKPVIPFFWYMVNPVNKRYGSEIIGKFDVFKYLEFINNYEWRSKGVRGIIWWEPSEKGFRKLLNKSKTSIRRQPKINSQNDILKYYNFLNN